LENLFANPEGGCFSKRFPINNLVLTLGLRVGDLCC